MLEEPRQVDYAVTVLYSDENAAYLKEAEKASYQAMQIAMETQMAGVPVAVSDARSTDAPMMVDVARQERGTKRGAEDSQDGDGHKRARIGKSFLRRAAYQ